MTLDDDTHPLDVIDDFGRASLENSNPDNKPEEVVAKYGDIEIVRLRVQSTLDSNRLGLTDTEGQSRKEMTWMEAMDTVILHEILIEESKAKGFTVTQEDIDRNVNVLKENYEMFPEAAEFIDKYCAEAGISPEEYWEMMNVEARPIIFIGKLRNDFRAQYTAEHWKDPERPTSEEQRSVNVAFSDYQKELFEKNKDKIEYLVLQE